MWTWTFLMARQMLHMLPEVFGDQVNGLPSGCAMSHRSVRAFVVLILVTELTLCSPFCRYGMPGEEHSHCHEHHSSAPAYAATGAASRTPAPVAGDKNAPAEGSNHQCCCPNVLQSEKGQQPTKDAIRAEAMVALYTAPASLVCSPSAPWAGASPIDGVHAYTSPVPLFLTQRSLLI